MATKEEIEEVCSYKHKYFPAKKLNALIYLSEGARTIKDILNDERTNPHATAERLIGMYQRLQRQNLVKHNDGIWKITNEGIKKIEFLLDRLDNEFYGWEGVQAYIEMRREESAKKKREEKYLKS